MKETLAVISLAATILVGGANSARAADIICYNCPPQWADWASMLKAIKADLGFDIPHDNKNSGQTLSQLLAEKSNPVADIGYFGVNFGIKGKAEGVLEPISRKVGRKFRPVKKIRTGLVCHPLGHARTVCQQGCPWWQARPRMLEGFIETRLQGHGGISRSVFRGRRLCGRGCHQSCAWRLAKQFRSGCDLLQGPAEKSTDRSETDIICARSLGRNSDPVRLRLQRLSGEIQEKGNFEFVIPCEGSVVFPYVIGLVKNAPNKDKAKKVLDFILSDKGQAIWTNAYLRPARPIQLPAECEGAFSRTANTSAPRALTGARWKRWRRVSRRVISPKFADATGARTYRAPISMRLARLLSGSVCSRLQSSSLAFFVVPMARLMIAGAGGPLGLVAYVAILTEPRYRATLFNTLCLPPPRRSQLSRSPPSRAYFCNVIVFPAGPWSWRC